MFIVEITAALVTLVAVAGAFGCRPDPGSSDGFEIQVAGWLWFTVLFATYAEAVAEARGRAQAATLRKTRSVTTAHRRTASGEHRGRRQRRAPGRRRRGRYRERDDPRRRRRHRGHRLRERVGHHGGVRARCSRSPARISAVQRHGRHHRRVSDQLVVRITANPGETFLDRMIALVEGAKRQRTPNEIALSILLSGPDAGVPAGDRHAAAVRPLRRCQRAGTWPWSPSSCVSSRPRSAGCCRPSASRAWTASHGSTSWP